MGLLFVLWCAVVIIWEDNQEYQSSKQTDIQTGWQKIVLRLEDLSYYINYNEIAIQASFII